MLPDINRSDLLALIGIFVGLPGFLVFAFSGALGLVIAALVVAIIIGLVVAYQYLDQPSINLLDSDKTFTFEDKEASRVTQVSRLTIKANYNGVRLFKLAGVTTDGSVEDILVDGESPTRQVVSAGETEINKEFPRALSRGEQRGITLAMTFVDSFVGQSTARWHHEVGHPTKQFQMRVVFHKEKPYRNVRAIRQRGHSQKALTDKLDATDDGLSAKLAVKGPRIGDVYTIEWDW